MRARELKRWLAEAKRLTPAQQEKVLAKLQGQRSEGLVARLVSERVPTACPHCVGLHRVRHGQSGGVQRFRCRDCGKTFNPLTGTALAGLRHRDRWPVTLRQAGCLPHQMAQTRIRWDVLGRTFAQATTTLARA